MSKWKKSIAMFLVVILTMAMIPMNVFGAVTITPNGTLNATTKPSHFKPDAYKGKVTIGSNRYVTVNNEAVASAGASATGGDRYFNFWDGAYGQSGVTLVSADSFLTAYNGLLDVGDGGGGTATNVTARASYVTGFIGADVAGTKIKKGAQYVAIQITATITLIGIEGESVVRGLAGTAVAAGTTLSGATAMTVAGTLPGIVSAGNSTVPNQVRDGRLMIFSRGLWDGISFPVVYNESTTNTEIYAKTAPTLLTPNTNTSIGDLVPYTVSAINIGNGNTSVKDVYNYQTKTIQLAGNTLGGTVGSISVQVNVGDKYLVDESKTNNGASPITVASDVVFFLQGNTLTYLLTGAKTYIVPVGALGTYTTISSGGVTGKIETGPVLTIAFSAPGESAVLGN